MDWLSFLVLIIGFVGIGAAWWMRRGANARSVVSIIEKRERQAQVKELDKATLLQIKEALRKDGGGAAVALLRQKTGMSKREARLTLDLIGEEDLRRQLDAWLREEDKPRAGGGDGL